MNSRNSGRTVSIPSPLVGASLDAVSFSERGLLERNAGSVTLRSSGPTPAKSRTDGDIEKVKVYARIRPALREDETPGALVWSEADGQLTIFRPEAPVPHSDFVFDKILGPNASQADVYAVAVSDVVADVLRGYNGTILAYGQTGAGKTYTLGNTAPDAIGMIPRAAAELFSAAARDSAHVYRITMSYIQIYMEMIQDLLNPSADNLPIREDAGGVFVAGACEVPVTSLEECLHYLELGEQNRVFAFTHLNAHSSRSHAVVMLTAVKSRKYLTNEERAQAEAPDQDGVVTQKVTVGKLYMVDLAGSERLKKSKSVGLRATEARSINLSLTMLGMCISARAQDLQHVPFRDSKLTRLLQESLGGNAKTSLILCLSDVRQHADESLQSLQFGARAARVCNKPVVNERLQMRQLTEELLAALEEGNERSTGLEAALSQTKEERDALQAALTRERARTSAVVEALRTEAKVKDEQAAAKLAQQAELLSERVQQLGHVQQQQGQLEQEMAKLKEEQQIREEAHRKEMAQLQQRLEEVQAAAMADWQAMEAEARSHQARLAAAAQQQAATFAFQLAQERAAAREQGTTVHLALTRLQRALGELVSGPVAPSQEGSGAAISGGTGGRIPVEGPSSKGDGSGSSGGIEASPRPSWAAAGLAVAAAVAASRRGGSSSGDGSTLLSGGSSAVQMIQAALGMADEDGCGDSGGGAPAEVDRAGGRAGPTAAAIAALVGEDDTDAGDVARRMRPIQSKELASISAAAVPHVNASANGGLHTLSTNHHASSLPVAVNPGHSSAQQQPKPTSSGICSTTGRIGCSMCRQHSNEILDIDAALAAARQDLIADLHTSSATTGSRAQPCGSTSSAVGSGSTSASRSVGRPAGHDASARQLSPRLSKNAQWNSGGDSSGGGSYAAEYATALANGIPSPCLPLKSYSRLHANGPAVKPPRAQTNGGLASEGGGAAAAAGSSGNRDEALSSGPSHGSLTPHAGLPTAAFAGARGNATLSTSSTADSGTHARPVPTPLLAEGGRNAATTANPPAVVNRYMAAVAAAAAAYEGEAAMRRCTGILSTNPAFDTYDSEGSKSEDMVTAMSAVGLPLMSLGTTRLSGAGVGQVEGGAPSLLTLSRECSVAEAPMASGSAAAAWPALPLFTGIQVQLDALMDMAAALKRVKTGLEARIVAQSFEISRRQAEYQHFETQSRGDLQAARSALEIAEQQLSSTTQELDAVRLVLADTVDEMGRTRCELDKTQERLDEMAGLYDSALMRLGEARGRLDEARGELEDRSQEALRLVADLSRTKSDLVSERSNLARALAESARSMAMTTKALAARHELQRQVRAVNTIKAAYKRYKLAQLRDQVEAKQQALHDAETHRREREVLQATLAGQALVQESVGVIQDAVGCILAAFVGRRYQLEARKSLQTRMGRLLSHGGSATSGGGAKASVAATGKPPLAGVPVVRLRSVAGAISSGGGVGPAASVGSRSAGIPPTPGAAFTSTGARWQIPSPLGLTMMLSAVTMPPLTTASMSMTTSTHQCHPQATTDDGGTGGYVSQAQRAVVFPPPLLQLPDDMATPASSLAAARAAVSDAASVGGSPVRGSVGSGAGNGVGVAITAAGGSNTSSAQVACSAESYSSAAVGGTDLSGHPVISVTAIPPDDVNSGAEPGSPCSSSNSCSGVPVVMAVPAA